MIEISKELFNEVMKNVSEIYNMKVVNDYLFWDNGYSNQINIYELAYKCKEWLIAKTDNDITISINRDMASVTLYIKEDADFHIEFADTEVEAIIKACEWRSDKIKES